MELLKPLTSWGENGSWENLNEQIVLRADLNQIV